jgi:hypothetical protein
MSEESRIQKGGEKIGKTVGDGLKKGIGAVTGFGKSVADKVDMTCDNCGKAMKPGGSVKKTVEGKEHQFCSDACATAWKPTSKAK